MASPDVITKEKDLTFSIQSVTSNATGFVGAFRWGPVNDPELISTTEAEIIKKFMSPNTETAVDFLSAANYLLYANPLYIVRASGPAAFNSVPPTKTAKYLKNFAEYQGATLTGYSFLGRFPGVVGNSLKISVANKTGYSTWAYKSSFAYTPGDDATFNVAIIDVDGVISGSAGTVLETYELMSKTLGAKKTDGTTAYIKQAIEDSSRWVYCGDVDSIDLTVDGLYEVTLVLGADDNDPENVLYSDGLDVFMNNETINVFRYFVSQASAQSKLIDVCDYRLDSVGFVAPRLSDVYNAVAPEETIQSYFDVTLNKNTSYGFGVDNWKLVYDKYRDTNVWIPCSSDAAGLHARAVAQNEAWTSPAGLNRGQLKNVIRLAYNPSKTQRDVLWESNINSICSFPGEGVVLWGDKTLYKAPSAFSRINVRSLFIVLKKNISRSARYMLFELNDETTRNLFQGSTDRYLDTIQSRGGVYAKKVICDESNNTSDVIDANEFVGDIYVKPARSINAIRLNFIAVGSGVSFEEIEG